jgi:hypothetical protein
LGIASTDVNQLDTSLLGQTKLPTSWSHSIGSALHGASEACWLNKELATRITRACCKAVSSTCDSALIAAGHSALRRSSRAEELFVGIPAISTKSNAGIVALRVNSVSNVAHFLVEVGIVQLQNPRHISLVVCK